MKIFNKIIDFKKLTSLIFPNKSLNFLNFKLLLYALSNSIQSFFNYERNYASEIYFYERQYFIERKNPIKVMENWRKYSDAFPKEVIKAIHEIKEQFKNEELKLLEIGSGPESNLAHYVDNNLFKVFAIDPLADIYRNILKKLNYKYPIIPINLKCEDLLKYFKKPTFHICFAQNSLDHTENPIKCLRNAYYLLKRGGILFICSNIKEGSRTNWTGLHQYDLSFYKKKLIISDRRGKIFNFFDERKINLDLIYYKKFLERDNIKRFKLAYKKL